MLIDRYLSTEILRNFSVGIGSLIVVFAGFSGAAQLSLAAEGRLELEAALRLIGLNTLVTLEILLPSALFFSILAALGRLYRDAEMDVLHACGVSRLRIVESVLKLALVVALFTAVISLFARPWAYRESYRLEAEAAAQFDLKRLATGEFVPMGDSDYTFIADAIDTEAGLHRSVFLHKSGEDGQRTELIFADAAALPTLDLEQELVARFDRGVNYSLDNRDTLDLTLVFDTLTVRLPANESRERYRRRAQSTEQLRSSSSPKDIAEYQWRLTTPLAVLLLAAAAVPLAHARPRATRTRGFMLALLAYVLLFSVVSVARTAVEEGKLAPLPGLWSGYALFAIGLLFLLFPPRWRWVRRR